MEAYGCFSTIPITTRSEALFCQGLCLPDIVVLAFTAMLDPDDPGRLGNIELSVDHPLIVQSVQVEGSSMYPTLTDSGHYWLNRFSYVISEPRQNDIVALKDPRDNTLEVKRIIAMPGQSVYLKDGRVYVNGKLLSEPYLLANTPTYAYEKNANEFICIGNDKFFVLGDNRNNSTDSRTFGAVPRQNILGKVIE